MRDPNPLNKTGPRMVATGRGAPESDLAGMPPDPDLDKESDTSNSVSTNYPKRAGSRDVAPATGFMGNQGNPRGYANGPISYPTPTNGNARPGGGSTIKKAG